LATKAPICSAGDPLADIIAYGSRPGDRWALVNWYRDVHRDEWGEMATGLRAMDGRVGMFGR